MAPVVTKKIGSLQFGILSPNDIKKMSKVQVITPELYDTDGYPVERGLMDANMGVIDPGLRCKTCGGQLKTCSGHFGSIPLAKQVIHISYAKQIFNLLTGFCSKCGRILLNPGDAKKCVDESENLKQECDINKMVAHETALLKKIKHKKTCPFCNASQAKVMFERPYYFKEDGRRVWPNEIHDRLSRIPDEDLRAVGYNPILMRPEWLVMTTLLVPPITIRPSITLQSGDRSEDDLTHKMSDIVRVNQRLNENINAGAPEVIIEDLWDLLQYHVTTYFDNKVPQIPPARHRTNRELRTLKQRISGKAGRFRYNLAGKRVNFCGRSIITPDLNIGLMGVGIPMVVAKEITIPEMVNEWNKKWLLDLIKNSPNYPGANYVESPDGKRRKVTDQTKEALLEELTSGWIVERHLMNGDPVVFNRQPSLHRLSMMCHIVTVTPGRTFRINPAVCKPYNADFDGDEMNLHVPQTEEARAEANNLLRIDKNLTTPRYGLSIIGEVVDMLFGLYVLTKRMNKIDKKLASEIIIGAGIDDPLPASKSGSYTGKQLASLLLPKDCNFESDDLKVKNGSLISGILSNKYIGQEGGILIHYIKQTYGEERAAKFIEGLQQLAISVNRVYPYSLSLNALDTDKGMDAKINKIIAKTLVNANKILADADKGTIVNLPGKTTYETTEAMILGILNQGRNDVGKLLESVSKEDNDLIVMINSKTRGKMLNLAQISGLVGQQALRGERIMFGYRGRALPHFERGDMGPLAHGFVKTNYKSGLKPLEFFFNAVVGRDAYIDMSVRTPKSGYMQRRLINALQDLRVHYDGTVRDSGEGIIQFKYGGDNIDVAKSDHGGLRLDG